MGLLALGVRLHVAAVSQILVDEPALRRAHRVQRDGAPEPQCVVGRAVGLAAQLLRAALVIAFGVPLAEPPLTRGRRDHAHRDVLDDADGLAVAADEQPEILAGEPAPHELAVVLDADLGIEAERIGHLLEQVAEGFGGGRRCHQRRRPERFFFLRGGRGGGAPDPLPTAAAAGAGWPRGCFFAPSPPPEVRGFSSDFASPAAGGGPTCPTVRRTRYCWPTVHTFVVIQ